MRFVLVLALLIVALPAQKVFHTYTQWAPTTLDPQLVNHAAYLRYHAQLFESPLEMGFGERGHCDIRPGICFKPIISEDGLTITLRVQQGIRFHPDACFKDGKGRQVTAADLRYMFMRHADPSHPSVYWESFLAGRITGLDAWRRRAQDHGVADYDAKLAGLIAEKDVFRLRLTAPYPTLISLLTQPWASIVPSEAVRRYGTGFGTAHPIGTGPFRFKSKDALGTVVLVKNTDYRMQGWPHIDEVRFEVVDDLDKRTTRFLNGDLHVLDVWANNADRLLNRFGLIQTALRRKGIRYTYSPPLEVSYFYFNLKNKILAKKGVREAFAYAIDRRALAKIVDGPGYQLANSPLPRVFPESAPVDAKPYLYDKRSPGRARKCLKDAGFPEGKGLPEFVFDCPGELAEKDRRAMALVKANLAEIGIKVQLREEKDFNAYMKRVGEGDVQIGWTRWYADYPDAENFLILFRSHESPTGTFNYGMYKNPEYDQLYDKMSKLYPGPERTEIITKMVDLIRHDVPWVFLYYPRHGMLVQKGVFGFRNNVLNYSLRDVQLR
ncbi:MAG: hypothetical protein CMJ83_18220 [Planctomycetes bacterium]|nr:hypothetical protein [Planctomycetota bacterium]